MINDWLSEYKNFMFSGKIENARRLTLQHFPQKLYKYRQVNDYTIENISTNTVWLSSPLSMNDPMSRPYIQTSNGRVTILFLKIGFGSI